MRGMVVLFGLVALWGCGSKPKARKAPVQRAEATVFIYNSVGKDLEVQVQFGDELPLLDLEIRPGGVRSFPVRWAQPLTVKVKSPAGLGWLNQRLDIPPAGSGNGDFLLDLGGAGSFHQWPLFYQLWGQGKQGKIPPDILEKYKARPIPGPKARYDLDFRAFGLNRRPNTYLPSNLEPNHGEVFWVIVDDPTLRTLERGGDLDTFER